MPVTKCPTKGTRVRLTCLRPSAPRRFALYNGETGVVVQSSYTGCTMGVAFHRGKIGLTKMLTLYLDEVDLISPDWWDVWIEEN